MPVDYEKIRYEKRNYDDPEIQDMVRSFVVESYADRTHFILELLQNAEDAMRKRALSWHGRRSVSFSLSPDMLRVSHFGTPFNEKDVRSICSVGRSSKQKLTTIGRFGIGFKSVFRFTNSPEVHSGNENFTIDRFVFPKPTHAIDKDQEETVFVLPIDRETQIKDYDVISHGLSNLNEGALLFLKNINELSWEVQDCKSGHYLREDVDKDEIARRVKLTHYSKDVTGEESDVNEEWIVFSRNVNHDGKAAGHVEIAFNVDITTETIRRLEESKLVVYFPTAEETRLGFLVQGPYVTTPNRGTVPPDDDWNKGLVDETCVLLGDALSWLRDRELLDATVLGCLPLDSFLWRMLEPLFDKTKELLSTERLLPKLGGGYIDAQQALIPRTSGLRELFSADQVSEILGMGRSMSWLHDSVQRDRDVRNYVIGHLGVQEVRPERLIPRLSADFLKKQTDEWIVKLYSFLKDVPNAINVQNPPALIRLDDGTHVQPFAANRPLAYLPGEVETESPTVKASVCEDPDALQFLKSLGLKQRDIIDDVVMDLMPKYKEASFEPDDETYEADVTKILYAYREATTDKRIQLLRELKSAAWVKAIDFGDGLRRRMPPGELYLVTPSLKGLLSIVVGFMFVDEEVEVLMGGEIRSLLKDCGAIDHLRPIYDCGMPSEDELREERRKAGHERTTGRSDRVKGFDLREIEELVYEVRKMDTQSQKDFARGLWRELKNLHQIFGSSVFERTYTWTDRGSYDTKFNANFVRKLNSSSWIPTQDGQLRRPSDVLFSDLGWDEDAFLQSKILFKPPKIHELANEVGFEPDVLELLKQLNLTTISKLREVGIFDDQTSGNGRAGETNEYRDDSEPFAKQLSEMQTKNPTPERDRPILPPEGGPKTAESAKVNAQKSRLIGGSGSRRQISGTRWTPTEASDDLSSEFRQMVLGDYGRRCQLCSNSFTKPDGELQVYVMHIVPPSKDGRANNFGDLVGVCGWHHALFKYGEWAFDFPEIRNTVSENESFEDWQVLRANIQSARRDVDDYGNRFVSIPIRFSNVFKDWASQPVIEKTVIRYSVPHWKHLCELLQV